jgi:nucleoside-diphosphate-sugar epimerase
MQYNHQKIKVLITGATGFIGRHLVDKLVTSNEFEIYATARQVEGLNSKVHWIKVDLNIQDWTEKLPEIGFDLVIHLAQSYEYRNFPEGAKSISKINVSSTADLASWSVKQKVKRFIFTSTGNVYGSEDRLFVETDIPKPESFYGVSKLCGEMLLKPFSDYMEIIILRLFTVFGPDQKDSMLPGIIDRVKSGQTVVLAGGVGVRFTPVYIDDCVGILIKAATVNIENSYEVVNVSGQKSVDLKKTIDVLGNITGKAINFKITNNRPKHLVGCMKRMNKLFGVVETSYEEALSRTYKSMK